MFKRIVTASIPIVLVFLLNLFFAYSSIDYTQELSTFMHVLGGFVVAWFFYSVYLYSSKRKLITIKPANLSFLFLIFFTISIGVVWEWYEFIYDIINKTSYQPSIADTMSDLLMDTIGSIIFIFIIKIFRRTKNTD